MTDQPFELATAHAEFKWSFVDGLKFLGLLVAGTALVFVKWDEITP